jgi:CDP-diacylglycerol--inositol 3-phosphatidyltransferase
MASSSETTAEEVLLFFPNLIGYSRVIFTLISFVLMIGFPAYWLLAICLYITSFVGDLFDGMVARKFHQTSTFGSLLDMVTDRCSTLGMLYILGGDYAVKDVDIGFPFFRLLFLFLVVLDIASHWCQMNSTSEKHHKSKESNEGRNVIVRWYYQYYWFFGYLCVGAEFSYICLFVRQHLQDSFWASWNTILLYACLPGCFMKQIVNLAQLASACYAVASYDAKQRSPQKQS